jgi:hypothetical protein
METIMSLCIFQSSRRYILSMLSEKLTTAEHARHEHASHNEEISAQEQQKIVNLASAIKSADAQVKRLEYWSDVRDMARSGKTAGATDSSYNWNDNEWTGLDNSGPAADATSTAKEKGKSRRQVKKEVVSQLKPKDSALGVEGQDQGKKAVKIASDLTESSDEAVYITAAENGHVEKGEGRIE